jgi:tetratricopeptide (TPR) repeat protein
MAMRIGCGLALTFLAWANLAACSPSQTSIAAVGQGQGSEDMAPCVDGLEDHLDQAIATCNKALAAPGLDDDQRAQLLNARATFYCQTAQYDLAIADHSEAIKLRPGIPLAYMERAACYIGKRDFKSALADYDEAIRLAPGAAGYYQKRGNIRIWAGDPTGALADYDQLVRLAPQPPGFVDDRARLLFGMGRFHEAAEQFAESARLLPTNPYPVLWLHMARARAHEPDDAEFQQGIKRLDLSGWPGPIFDMFLGKTAPDAMREAYSTSAYGPADGNCAAVFFAGEYELIRNDPDRAKDYFSEGTGACQWQVTQQENDFRFLDDWADLIRLNPAARGNGPLW